MKDIFFSSASNNEKLDMLLKGSQRILLKASSVFPFDFFPDELTIDENKVNIIFHPFFFSKDVHSIMIEMIRDIEVETGPFLAVLKLVPDGYPGHALELRYLKRNDALKARRIIEGLMVARRHGIDPSKLDSPDFLKQIETLGKTSLTE
ncbi:MAG: hypothetical protein AAB907_01145 [Patescibacteria group bacterium]